jgi:hypothetical protein
MADLWAKKKCGASRTFLVERKLTRFTVSELQSKFGKASIQLRQEFGRRYWNRTNDLHDVNVAL